MTAETIRRWCRACYVGAGIITFLIGFFVIVVMLNRHPAISYGGIGSVTIEDPATHLAEAKSGQEMQICFHEAAWLRLCPSVLVQRIQVDGRQFDLPRHVIDPPQHTGPLPAKCRTIKLPLFGDGVKGSAMFSGFARSKCWPTDEIWPIEVNLPPAHFEIK